MVNAASNVQCRFSLLVGRRDLGAEPPDEIQQLYSLYLTNHLKFQQIKSALSAFVIAYERLGLAQFCRNICLLQTTFEAHLAQEL